MRKIKKKKNKEKDRKNKREIYFIIKMLPKSRF